MDMTIKKLVYQYLNGTYRLSLDTLNDYKVILKTDESRVSIGMMYDDVKELFNIHPYNCGEYFESWIAEASMELNNSPQLYDTYSETRTHQSVRY